MIRIIKISSIGGNGSRVNHVSSTSIAVTRISLVIMKAKSTAWRGIRRLSLEQCVKAFGYMS